MTNVNSGYETQKKDEPQEKKFKSRVRSLLNHFYTLDNKLIGDLLNCQKSQLKSVLHLVQDLYIRDNEFLLNVFGNRKSNVFFVVCA